MENAKQFLMTLIIIVGVMLIAIAYHKYKTSKSNPEPEVIEEPIEEEEPGLAAIKEYEQRVQDDFVKLGTPVEITDNIKEFIEQYVAIPEGYHLTAGYKTETSYVWRYENDTSYILINFNIELSEAEPTYTEPRPKE